LLYTKYASISNIRKATNEELIEVLGKKKAELVLSYLNTKTE